MTDRTLLKRLEEITALQDKAIAALQQANLALQLALDALEKNRKEQGDQNKIIFVQPEKITPNYPAPYIQTPSPFTVPTSPWGASPTITGTGTKDWAQAQGWTMGVNTVGSGMSLGEVKTVVFNSTQTASASLQQAQLLKDAYVSESSSLGVGAVGAG